MTDASMADSDSVQVVAGLARELKVPVREIGRSAFAKEAITEAPQGVIARCESKTPVDLDEILESESTPFLVMLDGVTDPRNLGAILRTANAAGATAVVMSRHGSARLGPTAVKAAAGAVEHADIALVGGLPAAMDRCRSRGVWLVGLDGHGDRSVFDLDLATDPVCLVLGAEGAGISRLVRERCDAVASIPLVGEVESLNVSVAAGVAMYEVARRRRR